MPADRCFRIGSVSKLLASTAVLRLAEAGALDLDAPVVCYVAGVPKGDRITLHIFGRHMSWLAKPID